ncbi:MAG: hypothetical protein ACREMY_20080 [bacterium]
MTDGTTIGPEKWNLLLRQKQKKYIVEPNREFVPQAEVLQERVLWITSPA